MSKISKKKKRPPKYLEKMLLVNHKEDQLLQERLDDIHLKSRAREIELDRERIKVREELKESRRRQIPVDSVSPTEKISRAEPLLPKRKLGTVEKPNLQQISLLQSEKTSDNVNEYLLGEYRRMSEVIPSILLTLSKKDEKKSSKSSNMQIRKFEPLEQSEMEPDLHRFTKLARSVKKLRENMSFQKKIDMNRPRLSLAKMFKDIHDKRNEIDQYTDGTCVLLKRKIEKRRRESMPELDTSSFQRISADHEGPTHANRLTKIHSAPQIYDVINELNDSDEEKDEVFEDSVKPCLSGLKFRRSESLQFPSSTPAQISPTAEKAESGSIGPLAEKKHPVNYNRPLSLQVSSKRHSLPQRQLSSNISRCGTSHWRMDSHKKGEFIDEDELKAKHRVAMELEKYQQIKQKIDRFLSLEKQKAMSTRKEVGLLT